MIVLGTTRMLIESRAGLVHTERSTYRERPGACMDDADDSSVEPDSSQIGNLTSLCFKLLERQALNGNPAYTINFNQKNQPGTNCAAGLPHVTSRARQ